MKKSKTKKITTNVLPFAKLLDLSNPLQKSAFKMSILVCGVKILTRIINEFTMPAPASIVEVLVMIAYYLFDLLYGILAYVIALVVFSVIYDKLKSKKVADEDNAPSAE